MNQFESMVIYHPDLSENEVNTENDKLLSLIKELNGKIIKTDYWGKRTLVYPIKKRKEGTYFINYFALPVENIDKLERHYKISEKIIRFNILSHQESERVDSE